MEFMLDTANLEEIKRYIEIIQIAGVTTNPSIMKKEGNVDFFNHMKQIRAIIGFSRSLHIQVVANDFEGILKDARAILENIDSEVYIKVPVSKEGLRAIKVLKAEGIKVSATTIYTIIQAQLAIAAEVDYLIPYFNRMEDQNINSVEVLTNVATEIERAKSTSKLLVASFKNLGQVNASSNALAHAVTINIDILNAAFAMPAIEKAVGDFTRDWEASFGKGKRIFNL